MGANDRNDQTALLCTEVLSTAVCAQYRGFASPPALITAQAVAAHVTAGITAGIVIVDTRRALRTIRDSVAFAPLLVGAGLRC